MSASLNPVSASALPSLEVRKEQRRDPFERMNALDQRASRSWWLSWVLAFAMHGWGAGTATLGTFEINRFAELVQARVVEHLNASISIEEEPKPEPPEEEEPEPEEPEPEPEKPLVPIPAPPLDTSSPEEPPPPAAAEAAKVMTAEPPPDAPLDLTGEGFISGTGTRFAGGVTASAGTSTTAVRQRGAQAGGALGTRGEKPSGSVAPPVDLSKPAGLPVNANWSSCPFPAEADAEQINQAAVRVVVVVDTAGTPTSVNVLSDPGYGFGKQAQKCAMRFKYPVGLDTKGNPMTRATKPFRITFTR